MFDIKDVTRWFNRNDVVLGIIIIIESVDLILVEIMGKSVGIIIRSGVCVNNLNYINKNKINM